MALGLSRQAPAREPDPRAPTCDPAHTALQPPARLRSRVRAQAVADEMHVLGAVAQLGLRKDGASGSPGRVGTCWLGNWGWGQDSGKSDLRLQDRLGQRDPVPGPPQSPSPAGRLVYRPTVLTSGHCINCRPPWPGLAVRCLLPQATAGLPPHLPSRVWACLGQPA